MIKKKISTITRAEVQNHTRWFINYSRTKYTFLGIPFYVKDTEISRHRAIWQ